MLLDPTGPFPKTFPTVYGMFQNIVQYENIPHHTKRKFFLRYATERCLIDYATPIFNAPRPLDALSALYPVPLHRTIGLLSRLNLVYVFALSCDIMHKLDDR